MLSKCEMKIIMVDTFLEIITPQLSDLSLEQCMEQVIGKKSRSFRFNSLYISVDFALGVGNRVGCPTSSKKITVYFQKPNYVFERFTVSELKLAVNQRLNLRASSVTNEQLSLF